MEESTIDFSQLKIKPIRLKTTFKIMSLVKLIALHLKIDSQALINLWDKARNAKQITDFESESLKILIDVVDLILSEFDEETEQYGDIGKRVFTLITRITNLNQQQLEDITITDLKTLISFITGKVSQEKQEVFLEPTDMIQQNTLEKSSITETE